MRARTPASMESRDAITSLRELVAECDKRACELPLDKACLLISAVYDSSVDVNKYLVQLDAFASRAAATAGGADSYAMIAAVLRTLFAVGKFRGNERAYNEPANSLLSSVIDRRVGIPITLSVLLMEVSRRIGLPLEGVGLPGHFVVRFPDPTSRLYIDPFHDGAIRDMTQCVALVERIYHGRITWRDEFLAPLDHRSIVKRVLLNLKNTFSQVQDYSGGLAAIQLRILLDPTDITELRDRGILFARLRRYDRAIEDLEAYLRCSPDAGDSQHIRKTVQYLRQERKQ